MKKTTAFLTALSLALSLVPSMFVSAATAEYTVARDVYITQGNDTDHQTTGFDMYNIQISRDGWSNFGIFEFDLSEMLEGEVLNSALLTVIIKQNGLSADNELQAYKMADDVWPNDPPDQTGLTGNNTYSKIGDPIEGATAAIAVGASGNVQLDVTSYIQEQRAQGKERINIAVGFSRSTPSGEVFMLGPKEDGKAAKLELETIKPPAVAIQPLQSSYYKAGAAIPVSATVTAGDNSLATIEFLIDGQAPEMPDPPQSGLVTKEITGLQEGKHTIAVRVTDNEGNASTSEALTVYVVGDDVSLENGEIRQADATYVTKGYSSKPDSPYNLLIKNTGSEEWNQYAYVKFDLSTLTKSVINAKLRVNVKGGTPQDLQAYEVADNTWSYDTTVGINSPDFGDAIEGSRISIAENGNYSLDVTEYIKKKQNAGETTVSIGIFAPNAINKDIMLGGKGAEGVYLDYTVTNAPVISNMSPADQARLDPDSEVLLSAEVTDLDQNLESVTFYVDDVPTEAATEENGTYRANAGMLSIGWHTITVRAVDELGAVAEEQVEVNVALPIEITQEFTGAIEKNTPVASNFSMTNQNEEQMGGVAIIALYSAENKLLTMDFKTFELAGNSSQTPVSVGFTIPDIDTQGCTVKAFVWNGFELQQPISEIYTMD